MPSWNGKTRGNLLGYKIFFFTLKYLGLSIAYFILRFVVLYFLLFSVRSNRSQFIFFRKRLKQKYIRSVINLYKNYFVFGQILLDKIALLAEFKTNITFNFEGEEYLNHMVDSHSGGLIISAHIGNFDMASHLLKRLKTKVNIVILEAEHKKIKEFLSNVLKDSHFHNQDKKIDDINFITLKEDLSHIYEINNALENKEIICMHGDRYLDGAKTFSIPFLNEQALFPAGPFYLAIKYNIPVIFAFAMKESKSHYHFYATENKYFFQQNLGHKQRDEAIKSIIADFITAVENIIIKYPEQWFNYYDFWK